MLGSSGRHHLPLAAVAAERSRTEQALHIGIEAAQAGNRMGDLSAAIAGIAHEHGYGLPEGGASTRGPGRRRSAVR